MYAIAIIVIMFYITTKEEVSKQLYMREAVKKKKKKLWEIFWVKSYLTSAQWWYRICQYMSHLQA